MNPKVKLYVRAARAQGSRYRAPRVKASPKPNYAALTEQRDGQEVPIPTACFAIEIEIPEGVLDRAHAVAGSVLIEPGDVDVVVDTP